MFERQITIATHRYDQVEALHEGDVVIAGVRARSETAQIVTEIFERMIVGEAFDVAELGFTYYLRLLDSGDDRCVALPVFPARVSVSLRYCHVSGLRDWAHTFSSAHVGISLDKTMSHKAREKNWYSLADLIKSL